MEKRAKYSKKKKKKKRKKKVQHTDTRHVLSFGFDFGFSADHPVNTCSHCHFRFHSFYPTSIRLDQRNDRNDINHVAQNGHQEIDDIELGVINIILLLVLLNERNSNNNCRCFACSSAFVKIRLHFPHDFPRSSSDIIIIAITGSIAFRPLEPRSEQPRCICTWNGSIQNHRLFIAAVPHFAHRQFFFQSARKQEKDWRVRIRC